MNLCFRRSFIQKYPYRFLELVRDVVHGHSGAGPGQRLAQLLRPPQRLVDGARARRPLAHILTTIITISYLRSIFWPGPA